MKRPPRLPKVDMIEIFRLGREHGLLANHRWTLTVLALTSDWETREWTGTLASLKEDTGLGIKTVRSCVDALVDKGLVEIAVPFLQGREHARLRVVHLDRIVREWRARPHASNDGNSNASNDAIDPAPIASRSRRVRVVPASDDAIDQEERGVPLVHRQQGSGVGETGEICSCGELLSGHPFSDHEPAAAKRESEPGVDPDPEPAVDDLTDDETIDFTVTAEMIATAEALHAPRTPSDDDITRWEAEDDEGPDDRLLAGVAR